MDEPRRLELEEGCNESRSVEAFDGSSTTSKYELSNSFDICQRCSCIPWDDLLTDPRAWVPKEPVIKESKASLKASLCRICNSFAKIIEKQKLSESGPYL
jgi:hypothetical protein